jgi:transposase
LRRCYRKKDGKRHSYWALVESYRSSRGPRQRVVAYLGEMDEAGRLGIHQQAAGAAAIAQRGLFRGVDPLWVEVDLQRIAVERKRALGGPWIGLQLCRQVGLIDFLERTLPTGREEIPWPVMAQILILARLCDPSSELQIAERFYEASALSDLLGVPASKVNEDRLYRSLDQLLPHKEELERHLKNRLGELFDLDYDLLLYDVTSTYFEGEAKRNELAQRGYSRDHRPDCKQVNIALVVSRDGMPLGYQLFAGNRNDGTTLKEIVERIERLYGKANRIWVLDRGMVSEENLRFLKEAKRRYIVGTPKGVLKRFERELRAKDWQQVREGLQVRFCPAPGGEEVFLLCRSAQRKQKEQAMHERFEKRIEEGLEKIVASCQKRKHLPAAVGQRVGRLLGQNSRAAGAFEVKIDPDADGFAKFSWKKMDRWREWARLSEGCYVLRSNVTDWSPEELWRAYMQLTEAEAAFRIQKTDLQLRPIWHQKQERVEAHILVCFLAYVLWKTLAQLCQRAGLGNEPRKVFEELADITLVDVVLPTRNGVTIRKRCISRPTEHQAILLQHLNLCLPSSLEMAQM